MKLKFLHSLLLSVLIISPVLLSNNLQAQTTGTLTCSFTTTFTGGGYGTKYLLCAWIETNSGTFVKTKLKYVSSSNLDHVQTWATASGENVVDATVGATRSAPGALSFTWNGTNVAGTVVTDGIYKVWIEMAWASSLTTGKSVQSFTFTKGATADHQTGATTNILNLVLDWVPSGVGIANIQEKENFSISPNPVTNESTINYSLNKLSDVTINLYDINGKLVNVLLDKNQAAGNYSLPISFKGRVKSGVYFVKMYTGETQHTERIVISE